MLSTGKATQHLSVKRGGIRHRARGTLVADKHIVYSNAASINGLVNLRERPRHSKDHASRVQDCKEQNNA